MCTSYWKFPCNIQRRNKEENQWKGEFCQAYASTTNTITDASESTDSKSPGKAWVIW